MADVVVTSKKRGKLPHQVAYGDQVLGLFYARGDAVGFAYSVADQITRAMKGLGQLGDAETIEVVVR